MLLVPPFSGCIITSHTLMRVFGFEKSEQFQYTRLPVTFSDYRNVKYGYVIYNDQPESTIVIEGHEWFEERTSHIDRLSKQEKAGTAVSPPPVPSSPIAPGGTVDFDSVPDGGGETEEGGGDGDGDGGGETEEGGGDGDGDGDGGGGGAEEDKGDVFFGEEYVTEDEYEDAADETIIEGKRRKRGSHREGFDLIRPTRQARGSSVDDPDPFLLCFFRKEHEIIIPAEKSIRLSRDDSWNIFVRQLKSYIEYATDYANLAYPPELISIERDKQFVLQVGQQNWGRAIDFTVSLPEESFSELSFPQQSLTLSYDSKTLELESIPWDRSYNLSQYIPSFIVGDGLKLKKTSHESYVDGLGTRNIIGILTDNGKVHSAVPFVLDRYSHHIEVQLFDQFFQPVTFSKNIKLIAILKIVKYLAT